MTDTTPWPIHESETEYETGWYDGGYDLVEQPDGSQKRYYWASLPPAVVVVAILDDDVVFVEQYRPTIRETHLELPAGIVEPDDEPDRERPNAGRPDGDAYDGERHDDGALDGANGGRPITASPAAYRAGAARELEEETGFRPTQTTHLQTYTVATGVLSHERGIVVADGLEPGERERDSNEFIEVVRVPVDEALDRARRAPANDSSISALLLAREDGVL